MSIPRIELKQIVIPYLGKAFAGASFPVRRAYFVGQNYAGHAKEMGAVPRNAAAKEPFYFSKPTGCVFFPEDGKMRYPPKTSNYQHEVELVLAIGRGGANIPPQLAYRHICGYGVGLDMTRRDLQAAAKAAGRPWDFGKGADESSPMSSIVPVSLKSNDDILKEGLIRLRVNGQVRQESNLNDMITDIPHLISYLSQYVELEAGDVLFTGTPEGVAAIVRGDVLEAEIANVGELKVTVV